MSKQGGVDNTARRKWDRDEYLQKAQEIAREEEEKELAALQPPARGPAVQRQPLKQREYEVDLTSRLGKTQVVLPTQPLRQQAGYFCNVCDCVVKDSLNYLDHINGKKHQRALGMSMRVERSTLSQVQERFEMLKRKKGVGFTEEDFDKRLRQREEEEEEVKRQKREKRKEKKKEETHEPDLAEGEMDPELAAMLGFSSFSSTKK